MHHKSRPLRNLAFLLAFALFLPTLALAGNTDGLKLTIPLVNNPFLPPGMLAVYNPSNANAYWLDWQEIAASHADSYTLQEASDIDFR